MPEDRHGAEPPGLWLRRRRESAGLTQEELAEHAGLATRTVSNLESHRSRRPHSRSLLKLAGALGLSSRASDELLARFRLDFAEETVRCQPDGAPAAVPRQLPSTVPSLVGRSAEIAQLDQWLAEARQDPSGPAIFGIGGMAGVGKTALALCWAHRVAGEFPDGQLFVTLGSHGQVGQAADAAEALGGILLALGTAPGLMPSTLAGRSELYRRLVAGRRMLVVIDNALDAEQVRALTPGPGPAGCMVVMTSRMQLAELAATDGARLVSLDVLEPAQAAQLLLARLSADRARDEPPAVQHQAVEQVVALCGRLPLALVIVAARAATSGWRLSLIAAQLADASQRLDALDLGDSITNMRSVFSWSCQQLSPDAARLLRLLALLPGPDIAATAAVDATHPGLRELARASLITEHRPGRYKLHDLLRLYVAESASLART